MLVNMARIVPFRLIPLCLTLLLAATLAGCDMSGVANSINQWRADLLISNAHERRDAKDYRKSVDLLKQAASIAPKYPEVWYELCVAYEYTNEYDLAVQSCQQQVNLNPSAVSYNSLGMAYWDTKDYDKAATAFEQAVAKEDFYVFRDHYVWSLLISQQYEKAIPASRRLIEIAKEEPSPPADITTAYEYLGLAYAGAGQKENSRQAYQQALETFQKSQEGNRNTGSLSWSCSIDEEGRMTMRCESKPAGVNPAKGHK
jgi:tetratricopeptide (TPR) repeat protein